MLDFSWLPGPLANLFPRIVAAFRSRLKLDILTVGLPILTIVAGLIGYSKLEWDGTFHSATSILFNTLGSFTLKFNKGAAHNFYTDLAAILGVVLVYTWLFAVAFTVLREGTEKTLARLLARNHVIIIGDSELATRADKIWRKTGRHPLRLISRDASTPPDWRSRRVRTTFDETLVRPFALHRAQHVLIDLGDDMQTLTLAFRLLSSVMQEKQGRNHDAEWVVVVRNAALADHFAIKARELHPNAAEEAPLPTLHYIDPERLAARHFMAEHPLFLLAESRGQRRVHALIIGNTAIGRHLTELTFLTQLTAGPARPAVTVLTSSPDATRHAFFSGRPALANAVDIAFIDAEALDAFERRDGLAAELLDKREAEMPLTVAFLVSDDAQESIRGALLLHRIQRKMSRLRCPIFSYEKDADEADFLASSNKFDKAIGGFETFSLPHDYLQQEICDARKRDLLARALHDRYSKDSGPNWNALTESMRRANRNAADHWRAKMHMLGFVVDDIPAQTLGKLRKEDDDELAKQPRLANGDGSVSPMAAAVRCEHDRWMIERHLDGWAHGAKRDNDRQIHNLLVPWEVLERDFPGEIVKDADQIEATIACLVEHGDPEHVLEKRAADYEMPQAAA